DLDGSLEFAHHFNGAADGRIKTILGPHAPYTCPPDFLETVAEAARREGFGIHIHLSEIADQVQTSLDKYGRSPVAHVEALGLFDVPGQILCAHCVEIDEHDREILAEKGANV